MRSAAAFWAASATLLLASLGCLLLRRHARPDSRSYRRLTYAGIILMMMALGMGCDGLLLAVGAAP